MLTVYRATGGTKQWQRRTLCTTHKERPFKNGCNVQKILTNTYTHCQGPSQIDAHNGKPVTLCTPRSEKNSQKYVCPKTVKTNTKIQVYKTQQKTLEYPQHFGDSSKCELLIHLCTTHWQVHFNEQYSTKDLIYHILAHVCAQQWETGIHQ